MAKRVASDNATKNLIIEVIKSPFHEHSLDEIAFEKEILKVLPVLRRLRACYSQPSKVFTGCLVELSEILAPEHQIVLSDFNQQTLENLEGKKKPVKHHARWALSGGTKRFSDTLEKENPHALYPTSYRESSA